MNISSNDRWMYLAKPDKNGHRFFLEKGTHRIGVADNSGYWPDTTEDGETYVNIESELVLGEFGWVIPLFDCKGRERWTGDGWLTASWLHDVYRMPLKTPAGYITGFAERVR